MGHARGVTIASAFLSLPPKSQRSPHPSKKGPTVEPADRREFSLPAAAVRALENAHQIPLESDTRTGCRQHRRALLPCEACGNDHTRVTVRTSFVIHLRCESCGAVWNVPRLATEPA